MEQPPLIDIESTDGKNSRMAGCVGCFAKLLPLGVGLLSVLLILMLVVWFVWGDDLRKGDETTGGATSESVEDKKGVAGLLDKLKRTVKRGSEEKLVTTEGSEGEGSAAEATGAEGKSPEEGNETGQEEFGNLAEKGSSGGRNEATAIAAAREKASSGLPEGIVTKATSRGGSFGSATGTATSGGREGKYMIWRHNFSTSGSDLEFEIIFQEIGGQLHFRCFVMPYDAQTARLFSGGKGDLNLSFVNGSGAKVLPEKGIFTLPLAHMTAFESSGQVAGWVARGQLPLNAQKYTDLKSVRLGWDFDEELGDWLKELSEIRK